MLRILFLIPFFCVSCSVAQPHVAYFESIRNNEAQLTAFFSQMPKGGDLHHHYFGSVYAEPLLAYALQNNFYLNLDTFEIQPKKGNLGNWEALQAIAGTQKWPFYQQKIIEKWSVKNFNPANYPSDKHFFESFGKFAAAIYPTFESGLLELKNRAINEQVSYIETQLTTIPDSLDVSDLSEFSNQLRRFVEQKNEKEAFKAMEALYQVIIQRGAHQYATTFNTDFIAAMHTKLKMDDDQFTMRYQNYVLRFREPVELFKNLIIAFISADTSPLINGVNIVSPEDGATALKDYELHMFMYKFCHTKFPNVKYSLHAGELTLGMVLPEALTWHIDAAVNIAGAHRIGHGVAIVHEKNSYNLLRQMAKNKIPVEINLVSNEFILNVKDDRHPILFYHANSVPIVISTDDAGVLRTNLTEQYVLLAKRYPTLSYTDIKAFVYNSIAYSFIEQPQLKKQLLADLDQRFLRFEAQFK